MPRIRIRRGTAAHWTASNPVLALGEAGLETNTRRIKYGDGFTAWNDLEYAVTAESIGAVDSVSLQPITVFNAVERKSLDNAIPGVTRVIQSDLPGIIWTLVAQDASLDASWIGQPQTSDPDGKLVISLEIADVTDTIPAIGILGRLGTELTVGDGVTVGGVPVGGSVVYITAAAYEALTLEEQEDGTIIFAIIG